MSQFNKLFDDKPALRKQILEQRLAMPRKLWETKSRQIGQNLKFWLHTKPFTRFILYRHFRQEPNLNSLA
ncbi:MAG: hypothetical protein NTX25_16100, partial [Proteobacteria bacterium]|nr:hypothetical protein [Pseudomonadota bacterium]